MQSLRVAESSRLLRTSLFASNCAKGHYAGSQRPLGVSVIIISFILQMRK